MMHHTPLKIGTRGSPLALRQAEIVQNLLIAEGVDPGLIEIVPIMTKGDQLPDRPLSEVGGKGLFCKAIDEALLAGHITIAVHSAKDMPTTLPDGLMIAASLTREDPRDVLITTDKRPLADLPHGARVGTASLRRQVQLAHLRPDLRFQLIRGNINTRLQKLETQGMEATLMAYAGLHRLGFQEHLNHPFEIDAMIPAVGQGVICICVRTTDTQIRAIIDPLMDPLTHTCLEAERIFLRTLDGNCRTPIAGYATLNDGTITMHGMLASPEGTYMVKDVLEGKNAEEVGVTLAQNLEARLTRLMP